MKARPGAIGRRRRPAVMSLVLTALASGVIAPSAARALPGSGPHETVDVTTSTGQAGASAGLSYSAQYHAAGNPQAAPPALRRLVFELPPGTQTDTSLLPRCTASDSELMARGESACPPASRLGSGQVTASVTGFGTMTLDTVIYNAADQQLELAESGGRVMGVAHTYIHGTTLDGPVPTCLTGGSPPTGCPFDQVTLLSQHLAFAPVTVGSGPSERHYGTTPPTCPPSGAWQTSLTLYYADGSVDSVLTHQPCAKSPPRGPAAGGGKSPRLIVRFFGRHRHRGVLLRVHTSTGILKHVTVQLVRRGHTVAGTTIARADVRPRVAWLYPRHPGAGSYLLIAKHNGHVLLRRRVRLG